MVAVSKSYHLETAIKLHIRAAAGVLLCVNTQECSLRLFSLPHFSFVKFSAAKNEVQILKPKPNWVPLPSHPKQFSVHELYWFVWIDQVDLALDKREKMDGWTCTRFISTRAGMDVIWCFALGANYFRVHSAWTKSRWRRCTVLCVCFWKPRNINHQMKRWSGGILHTARRVSFRS